MYLDLSSWLILAGTIASPLVLVLAAWFLVGGGADAVVERVTDLVVLTILPAVPTALRRARWAAGNLLVTLGQRWVQYEGYPAARSGKGEAVRS
jgi:hypothetical protein